MRRPKESLVQKIKRKREALFEAGRIRAVEIQKMKERVKKAQSK